MNYSNFELIYRNSIPPTHTYQFINVVNNDNATDENLVFTIDQEKFILEVSLESAKIYPGSSKDKGVDRAINESRQFCKNAWYLYNQEGKFGRYHIERQTFEPFDDDANAAAQKVHEFYYKTMSPK
jgi:hypothetical protein